MNALPRYNMQTGSADRLGQFIEKFSFFSPALPFIYGRMTDRPLIEFMEQYQGSEPHFLTRRFRHPIFQGMEVDGNQIWNHVLWAVERQAYRQFENFVLSVTLSDSPKRVIYRHGVTDTEVSDPLFLESHPVYMPDQVPWLPITVFGVDGSKAAVTVFRSPSRDGPRVIHAKPQPRTVLFAQQYFLGNDASRVLALPADATSAAAPSIPTGGLDTLPPDKRELFSRSIDDYREDDK